MDILEQIAFRIVEEQQNIIGPLAYEQATKVAGIVFSEDKKSLVLSGDKAGLIDQLVARYERLFGQASVLVCRDAAAPLLPNLKTGETPSSLA